MHSGGLSCLLPYGLYLFAGLASRIAALSLVRLYILYSKLNVSTINRDVARERA